jgi:hypothetical protein
MNKQTFLWKGWLTGAVFLSACNSTPINLGPELDVKYEAAPSRQISAEACGFQLLLLIPIASNSRQEKAYQMLKAQAGGDYIADIKITERWTYALVGTVYCTTLEATAYPKSKT